MRVHWDEIGIRAGTEKERQSLPDSMWSDPRSGMNIALLSGSATSGKGPGLGTGRGARDDGQCIPGLRRSLQPLFVRTPVSEARNTSQTVSGDADVDRVTEGKHQD